MTVRSELIAQLARFDEEAFVALANRGLLRRAQKDLEAQAEVRSEVTADAVVVLISQQRVTFDHRGPARARCTCPAGGICQHILAASLWLQRQAQSQPTTPKEDGVVDTTPSTPDALVHTLLGIDAAMLLKHAGKPGYRWAWQFVQDLDVERDVTVSGDRNLIIAFARPRLTFRFMGGGLDQLIADAQLSQLEKYRVAAVLALRRVHGLELPAPEASKPRTGQLDLGKDHALPEDGEFAQGDSRSRLRRSARQLIEECIELGLSHLSQGIQERFSTLATWSQGAEYYRLAMALRRLADHVELLLERSGGADEHRLLDELTVSYALIQALESAEAKGQAPAHLVGRARNRYDETATLELVGLGAWPWRSASGYVGLTMMFWSPADRSFLSCTDARPELQRNFNPVQRYKAPGPWPGMGAPLQATGRRVVLSKPQISAGGRISGSERTQATIMAPIEFDALRASLAPSTNWASLIQSRSHARRSLLAEADPMMDWVALQPAGFERSAFDAARQTLLLPLVDDTGEILLAEIPYSEFSAHAIERVEQWSAHPGAAGSILLARLRPAGNGLVAEPLSLLAPGASNGKSAIDALYFDPAPSHGPVESIVGTIRKLRRTPAESRESIQHSPIPQPLRTLIDWIRRQAERGISVESHARFRQEWQSHAVALRTAGFSAFPATLEVQSKCPSQLFRANFLALQIQSLFGARTESE